MKANKKTSSGVLAVVVLMILAAFQTQLLAQSSGVKTSAERNSSVVARWSVQVDAVDPGDVNLEPAFRVAIYENLLDELAKMKHFKQVFRSGDRNATGLVDLLILKTTVQNYTPGSETRRCYHRDRGYKIERPKPALHTTGPSRFGTRRERQCPFFRRQPASHPQLGAQRRQ
jgi:hypothetical protein